MGINYAAHAAQKFATVANKEEIFCLCVVAVWLEA